MWDEVIHPFPKLQRCNRCNLEMDYRFHPTLYWACDLLSILGTTLNNVSKWPSDVPMLLVTAITIWLPRVQWVLHYNDVIMGGLASQITSLTIVYSAVYSGSDQRKHQSSASLAFVWGIHRSPVNSPHKGPVTRKMFPFDDVIMGFTSFI